MKRLFGCLLLAMLISACGNENPQTTPAAAPGGASAPEAGTAATAEHSGPRVAPEGDTGAEFLAQEGVVLDFPHEINYDILDTSRNGTSRHRVLIEVLGGDFTPVTADFTANLEKIGYRKASESTKGQAMEQVYVQEGKPTYYLLMQPVGTGPELGNPDAVGSIHIMWNKP